MRIARALDWPIPAGLAFAAALLLSACPAPSTTLITCASDAECLEGSACVGGACVACPTCPEGEACLAGKCEPTSCGEGEPCRAGYVCSASHCVDRACSGVACPAGQACAKGQCYLADCSSADCTASEVCAASSCTFVGCVGVACDADEICVDGQCAPQVCAGVVCASDAACVDGVCHAVRCQGVVCVGDTRCAEGRCVPTSCAEGGCPPGQVCLDGRCQDAECAGLSCPAGTRCQGAACLACPPDVPATEADCGDGRDDDCDGAADCGDLDCKGRPCDDGDPCTWGEACSPAGRCVGDATACESPPEPACQQAQGECTAAAGGCSYPDKVDVRRCAGATTGCVPSTGCCTDKECNGGRCSKGACSCTTTQRSCRGGCIPVGDCCDDADCAVTGQVCGTDGSCSCPPGERPCLGACVAGTGCCAGPDCGDRGDGCADGTCTCQGGAECGAGQWCKPGAGCVSRDCPLPWGGTLADGQAIAAYQEAGPAGACVSEERACTKGSLSGSFANAACAAGCALPWGVTVRSGESATAWQEASPAGACVSEQRACTDGALSGSYANQACTAGCALPWGGAIRSGESATAWQAASPVGACVSEQRTCAAGVLSGSFASQGCVAGCALPWGGAISNGESATAYQTDHPAGTCASVSQVRTCAAGTLSGTYDKSTCLNGCALPWGGWIKHGEWKTAWDTSTAVSPDVCSNHAAQRSCSDGTLGGGSSYSYGTCSDACVAWYGDYCEVTDRIYAEPACEPFASVHCSTPPNGYFASSKDYCVYDGSTDYLVADSALWPCGYCWCWATRSSSYSCDGTCN